MEVATENRHPPPYVLINTYIQLNSWVILNTTTKGYWHFLQFNPNPSYWNINPYLTPERWYLESCTVTLE